jgi:exopolysaccharide biosynthesis WecB/TagA/CpsF family protein
MEFSIGRHRVAVNVSGRDALLSQARHKLETVQGFAVATLNLDHLVKIAASQDFATAYARHDMVVADGQPIVWLSWLARKKVSLAPGSDLVEPLCAVARDAGASVALIGSTEEVLQNSARSLEESVPGLNVALRLSPSHDFDPVGLEADWILASLQASGARLCLLALGAPKQEIFAARAREIAPNVGFVSVGAGLDFIAGHQTRAPAWMRSLALEWLWRAMFSPARLIPRYARCFAVLPGLVVSSLRLRMQMQMQDEADVTYIR